MFPDFPQPISPQPQLFLLEESIGTLELFPAVWSALEELTKADPEARINALEQLIELDAPRFSPVVSYILVTKITDSPLEFRARLIEVLGKVLTPDENGIPASEDVRNCLHLYLSGFRTRQIYALLQVSAVNNSLEEHISRLLNACPFAGNHLINILNDSKTPIDIRMGAAVMIGKVGYLDTLPALEKLSRRMEARISGQKTMDFAQQRSSIELRLLPVVNEALRTLRAP